MAGSRLPAWALALGLVGGATPGAAQGLSFSNALSAATAQAPADAIPIGITLYEDAYIVLFAGEQGSLALAVEPSSGRVLQAGQIAIAPARGRFTPTLRRLAARSNAPRLADAVAFAEQHYHPLHAVALQDANGQLVVEVQLVENGRIAGRLLDAQTGREIAG